MNITHKYIVSTLRTLFGVLMFASGVVGLMMATSGSLEGVPQESLVLTQTLMDSGIMSAVKVVETVAGGMLLVNFLAPLAIIFLAPIVVGILVVNIMTNPPGIVIGVVLCLIEAYFGYVYWDSYKQLFKRN